MGSGLELLSVQLGLVSVTGLLFSMQPSGQFMEIVEKLLNGTRADHCLWPSSNQGGALWV